jgi:hypothetical protein
LSQQTITTQAVNATAGIHLALDSWNSSAADNIGRGVGIAVVTCYLQYPLHTAKIKSNPHNFLITPGDEILFNVS